MEVISHVFVRPDPARTAIGSTRPPRPATDYAPSVTLPLRYVLVGLASLLATSVVLIARPDLLATYHYNQYIIATTHLVVLGFVLSIAQGAMFQLVPVALETRLWSERLGRWQFPAHVLGFAGMVVTFWHWNMKQVGHYGSLLALAVGLFLVNMIRTLRGCPRRDAAWYGIASVLAWLGFTVLAGLYLAASKCWAFSPFGTIPAMHAHAHAGVLGVFLLLIVAVSYRLVPMFVLSRIQSERRARVSIHLFNAGLVGLVVTLLLNSVWKLLFGLVLISALVAYGIELHAILRVRTRRRLDWGLRAFLSGIVLLAPLAVLGIVLCWPRLPVTGLTTQLENLYGLFGILGVLGLALIGMLHKIAPFLVWYHSYSHRVGLERVPALAEMYSTRLQVANYLSYLPGLAILGLGTVMGNTSVVRIGAWVWAVSLAFLAVNMLRILSHWFRARGGCLQTAHSGSPTLSASLQ